MFRKLFAFVLIFPIHSSFAQDDQDSLALVQFASSIHCSAIEELIESSGVLNECDTVFLVQGDDKKKFRRRIRPIKRLLANREIVLIEKPNLDSSQMKSGIYIVSDFVTSLYKYENDRVVLQLKWSNKPLSYRELPSGITLLFSKGKLLTISVYKDLLIDGLHIHFDKKCTEVTRYQQGKWFDSRKYCGEELIYSATYSEESNQYIHRWFENGQVVEEKIRD